MSEDESDDETLGSWIRVNDNLPTHPKTTKVARKLGVSIEHAVGIIVCAWARVKANNPDGNLEDYDVEDLDALCGFAGAAEALICARFVRTDADGKPANLNDFMKYNGKSTDAKRAKRYRDKKKAERLAQEEEQTRASVTRHASDRDATGRVTPYVNTSRLVDPPKEDPSSFAEGVQGEIPQPLIPVDPEPPPDVATPDRVFALYLAVLPDAGWVRHSKLTKGLRASIAARLRESASRRSIGWWVALFARIVERCTWPPSKGCATLEYIVRSEDQLVAFADGAKDDRGPSTPSTPARPMTVAEELRAKAAQLRARAGGGEQPELVARLALPAPKRSGYIARAPPSSPENEQGAFGFGDVVRGGGA